MDPLCSVCIWTASQEGVNKNALIPMCKDLMLILTIDKYMYNWFLYRVLVVELWVEQGSIDQYKETEVCVLIPAYM